MIKIVFKTFTLILKKENFVSLEIKGSVVNYYFLENGKFIKKWEEYDFFKGIFILDNNNQWVKI